jgi:hypothetical protein
MGAVTRSGVSVAVRTPSKGDDIAVVALYWSLRPSLLEKLWCHVPALAIIRDDADCLLVIARNHSRHRRTSVWIKRNSLADPEFEHARVCVQLSQKPQPCHDAVVEVDRVGLGHLVDVDWHCRLLSLSLPSSYAFPERRVHPRLPAGSRCPKKRQHLVRDPHRRLSLLARAGGRPRRTSFLPS